MTTIEAPKTTPKEVRAAFDSAPVQLRGKRRLRWALDVLKVGEEYRLEKDLRLQIEVLTGRARPNGDGTYTILAAV